MKKVDEEIGNKYFLLSSLKLLLNTSFSSPVSLFIFPLYFSVGDFI